MRHRTLVGLLGVLGLVSVPLWPAPAADPAAKTALEADPRGWVDLLGDGLKRWKRVPLPPDEKLNAKNAWSLSDDGKTLLCDGVGVKEMLLHEQERGDGIFHVEWRFRKVEGTPDYNGGVYVRSRLDGQVWHQAQVAHLMKPPLLGDLFGFTLKDGKPEKFEVRGEGHKYAHPPGQWNTFEVTCQGPSVVVHVNGKQATTWTDCPVAEGHVGMQAEFFFLEFRNLKFKDLAGRPGR